MAARSPEEEPEEPHGEDRTNASTRPHDSNVDFDWQPPGLAEYEQIRDLIDRGSLLEALRANLSLALQLMAQDARADPSRRQEFISNLTSQLQQRAIDRLSLARARAEITDEPQKISQDLAIALGEAAKPLPDRVPASSLLRSLKSFPPLAVIPNLIAFLGVVRDGPVRDEAFQLFEHLIFHGLAAHAGDSPEARYCHDLTLPFFAAILDPGGPALDEQERATVASIILRCAGTLGGDLHSVIARLAQLSHIGVEPMGLRLSPGALSLLLHSKEPKHRIEAVRCLGAYGPTGAEVQKALYLAGEDVNQELRQEAAAALAQNRARGKEQAAETRRQPSLTPEVRTREMVGMDAGAQTIERERQRPATVPDGPELVQGTLPARPGLSSGGMAILAVVEDIDKELALTRRSVLPKLESLLALMHKAGTMGDYEENAKIVEKINSFVASCLVQLTYTDPEKGLAEAPVNLDCRKKGGYPTGGFRLRKADKTQMEITTKKDFPLLRLLPLPGTPALGPSSSGF